MADGQGRALSSGSIPDVPLRRKKTETPGWQICWLGVFA